MTFRFKQAADLLGVSDDTIRRWAEGGRFATTVDVGGRRAVEGPVLARSTNVVVEVPRLLPRPATGAT